MAREQLNVADLLPLLESSDLQELEEIKGLINEHLQTDRGSLLLNSLVDCYLETSSQQALHILSSVREPHDKHLFDKMNECMARPSCRFPTLTLLGHVIRKQPPWIHKISRTPLLLSLLKCLKTDTDVLVLITGVLVLIVLLPMIPQAGKQHLNEFFDVFGRLAAWNLKNPGHVTEVYLIHLHASVYSLFHRLYGMYPCNFVSYLRSQYSMKENVETFEEVVKPMLEHVRIHPELVTGTKDHELDPTRWKRFEVHDIVIECAKVSLDPKEASCEEGYSTMPEHFSTHLQHRPADCTASPFADLHSSYGSSSSASFSTPRQAAPPLSGTQPPYHSPQVCRHLPDASQDPFWSPSSVCGMTTPPSSRGISPTNAPPELSHSASHLTSRAQAPAAAGGKGTPSTTPATCSPPPALCDDCVHVAPPSHAASPPQKDGKPEASKPGLVRQAPVRESEKEGADVANSQDAGGENAMTVTLTELPGLIKQLEQQERMEKERDEDAIAEELLNIAADEREASGPRGGFDSPFYRTTETLTGSQKKALPLAPSCSLSSDPHNAVSTPDRAGPRGGRVPYGLEQPCGFQAVFTPIDHAARGQPPRSPSAPAPGEAPGKYGLLSPSPYKLQPLPYESLFDLALPKAASLFVGKKTAEAAWRAGAEGLGDEDVGEGAASTTSPLEVLDRLIQQGSDAHDEVLKRLPLPTKSADWTHFGGKQQGIKTKGSAPLDELHTLRSQLLLLHNQLLYERYKREQHAIRNRRLLRRIINATALEEQNTAMKDQLSLQEVDIQCLKDSLQKEQSKYQRLLEDRETAVTRLSGQIRQLQQGCSEYHTKNQELQSKLQECQKKVGELEAELQKANNKVCNTGHLLNQLSVKLNNSETIQGQMEFLNKQLLLVGEVNKLAMEELQHSSPDPSKEVDMIRASYGKELERLRQSLVQQGQRLEAAQYRIGELESQLTKKEHLIVEQKKFLEDVKSQAKGELQASQSRYQAQRQVTQALQTELLELYSRLEKEDAVAGAGAAAAGGATEPCKPTDSRTDGASSGSPRQVAPRDRTGSQTDCPKGNGSTLSPGQPPPSLPAGHGGSVNGSRDPPLVLLEPPPAPGHAPLTVGSYPTAKSFLGMRARELFRNKSESQCDEEPPRLAGLSQALKTEQCVEPAGAAPPPEPPRPPEGSGAQQRQQQLRIMDYNEAHHEHS